ncbi:DMBT1 [Branchiostoma lanceolatum]|uniref:DMBT1 protein n=2 Tax=Branchiostoma lanceolatum TaxID=7740 RepID=A0A8J9Z0S3_BRALA|nr:DMBT1 [Branchiostoma lanceolatum]
MFLFETAMISLCCLSATFAYSNEDFILVADTKMNSICQVNVTSGQKTSLPFGNLSRPFALDYDFNNDFIYWTGDGKILRSHRNGTGRRELLDSNITAEGLALDLAGHNIFWTDVGRKTISAARIDGSYQRTLISDNLDRPRAIVLQPSNGSMYWTDCGHEPKIERAAMDGSGRTTLINTHLGKPTGLAIDVRENALYWCDGGDLHLRLERSDLLGNNRRVVVSYPNTQFLGIAVDDGNIYWTATDEIKLARTSEANTGLRLAIGSGYGELNGIHLHKDGVVTDVTNACSSYNGGCHNLCLALPGGRTCACRDGWILQDDESTCTPPDVRLVGGSSHHDGRVEIRLNRGEWRTVCDDNWNINNARVVCRQMGYPDAAEAKIAAYFGQGSGTIGLDDVDCTGNETSLFECAHSGWGISNCGHQEDAGVICMLDVRLVGGGSAYKGRVEVLHGGVWGTVCDRGWDKKDADVVCRQLGYPEAATAESAAAFGEGAGPIWVDDAACTGYETRLTKCGHTGWNASSCDHSQDAGVVCQLLAVRLVDGNTANEGRIEVFYQGKWGSVCDDGWNLKAARVVCRRLGYPDATSALKEASFGEGSGPIWLDDLVCQGNESGLSECGHNGLGVVNCGHDEDAGVVCATPSDLTTATTATTATTGAPDVFTHRRRTYSS